MSRTLSVCALLFALPVVHAAEPEAPTETVIRLTVSPAAEPVPALKYQLLPDLTEMMPGNPVQEYLKCFCEQNNFFFSKSAVDEREKWADMPLKDLPARKVGDYGRGPLTRADRAARMTTPEWQILLEARENGVWTLLPDLQQMRLLARCLRVRFRFEVARGEFDKAVVTAKTLLALARHLDEHPTLIGELVGMAVARIALDPLQEMIGQPNCPNLYWALTDLPRPFIDLRSGLQGERLLLDPEFARFDAQEPMSERQLAKALDRLDKLMKAVDEPGKPKPDHRKWLRDRAADKDHVAAARKRLRRSGAVEAVKDFPPLQVVLLDEKLTYEVRRDADLKAMNLPYWETEAVLARAKKEPLPDSLLGDLVGAMDKVRMAQAALDQRIALLRGVEAIRLYAANKGKLPARFADVPVPVPADPITGKPIQFERAGDTVILRGTPPTGMEKVASYNVRYVIKIAK